MIAKYYKSKILVIAESYHGKITDRLPVKNEEEAKKICKERKIKMLK